MKAYLCNQSGTVSPFVSRLACQILSLTNKHGITLILAYIRTHIPMWRMIICPRVGVFPEWHLLPQVAKAAFCLLGSTRDGYAGIPPIPLNASIITPWNTPLPFGDLGVECLQPSLDILGKLCVLLLPH